MKLSKLAKEILLRHSENTSEGKRIAIDGLREIFSAIALEKKGLGRFVSERSETRHAGDYRTVNYGGHFYPSA
jgi:hypothetical protein